MRSIVGSRVFTRAAMNADMFIDNLERLGEILPMIAEQNKRKKKIQKEKGNKKTENHSLFANSSV